jgi:ankyrin repeat protein
MKKKIIIHAAAILISAIVLGCEPDKDNYHGGASHALPSVQVTQHMPPDMAESDGSTALMVAISKNRKEMVEALIRAGADVNARDDTGMTPLMYAAMRGSLEIVKFLHKSGADINARADLGDRS